MSNRDQRRERLRKLQETKLKGGKNSDDIYEDVYEEVSVADYNKQASKRMMDDDFIVDDDGKGYVETGEYEWDQDSEDYEDHTVSSKRSKRHKSKGNSEGPTLNEMWNAPRQVRVSRVAEQSGQSVSTSKEPAVVDENDDLLDGLLNDIDEKTFTKAPKSFKTNNSANSDSQTHDASYKKSSPSREIKAEEPLMQNGYDSLPQQLWRSPEKSEIPSSPPASIAMATKQWDAEDANIESDESDEDIAPRRKIIAGDRTLQKEIHPASVKRDQPAATTVTTSAASSSPAPSSPYSDNDDMTIPDILNEDGTLSFYWLDYVEFPTALLIIGKVRVNDEFKSCALKLSNPTKNVYFLPRSEFTSENVYEELSQQVAKWGISQFKSRPVTRKYCFEEADVPREAEYLEALLPHQFMEPSKLQNLHGETYSHIFGAKSSMFEHFVLRYNIMGPCWLTIKNPSVEASQATSYCEIEVSADYGSVAVSANQGTGPPLTIMSLSVKAQVNEKDAKSEIIAISCKVFKGVDIEGSGEPKDSVMRTIMRPPISTANLWPAGFKPEDISNHAVSNEEILLRSFLAFIRQQDPDVILGHQLEGVHLSLIQSRIKEKMGKITRWDMLSRVKRKRWIDRSNSNLDFSRELFAGRLLVDLSNEFGRSLATKCDTWSLSEMAKLYTGTERPDQDSFIRSSDAEDPGLLKSHLKMNEFDTQIFMSLAFSLQIFSLSKQLTVLSGNSWAGTLSGSRVQRNNFILLHEFSKAGFIIKEPIKSGHQKNKNKYKGGKVLDPEKGLYDTIILVMDFNSLYPSIIQEYNICFTTVDLRTQAVEADDNDDVAPAKVLDQTPGLFPKLIQTLVDRRRQVKALIKQGSKSGTPQQIAQWDIKQQALKLTANSMYGCLGTPNSRFYARPLAELTTFKGREVLTATKELAESLGLQVVYGDTDSVMINTGVFDYEEALQIGETFKKKVNDCYRKLEIDIDNVFGRLLLHQKKKYAAVNLSGPHGENKKVEVKGLDMRRREYCQLSKDASKFALDKILFQDPESALSEIHEYLTDLAEKVRGHQIPLQKFIIKNQLGKDPAAYPENQRLPQVTVALRRRANREIIRAEDVISYIITSALPSDNSSGKETLPVADRAYTLQEVKEKGLKIDAEFYLLKQILPPLERLCAPIKGTDIVRIAQCLGLDSRKYHLSSSAFQASEDQHVFQTLESQIPDEERFKDVHHFSVSCHSCSQVFDLEGLDAYGPKGVVCKNCQTNISQARINGQLESFIKREIARYYAGWLVCKDCAHRTRQMNVFSGKCYGNGGQCQGTPEFEFSDKALYTQLVYLKRLFDGKENEAELLAINKARLESSQSVVDAYLQQCGRRFIDMRAIFS